ncbi:response regulator [Halobacteriovorax sp. GB3]|uniref:response regulator n=1 Tax=Halobacteriovorax sp. GB3 TaxID=2719615 RepID=UPI00235E02D0|nr:response regulator [Halobacteriovorax sp. GB3]MDD0851592.1 response regulator [Halobacteriovorax sp. GB3]
MEDFELEFKRNTLDELSDLYGELNDTLANKSFQDIDDQDIDQIFRIVHSVKGNAKACEFNELKDIAHLFENLLIKVRDDGVHYSEGLHDITLEFTDRTQEAIDFLKNDIEFPLDFSKLTNIIDSFENIAYHDSKTEQLSDDDDSDDLDFNGHNLSKGNVAINVLIVDDDPSVAEIISYYLSTKFKANIQMAENGKAALELCQSQEFHLIISDFKMPIMNGGEFIQQLRDENSPNKLTPIIFLSGYRPQLSPEQSMWEDVFFVEKPFNEAKILYYTKCSLELKEAKLYANVS